MSDFNFINRDGFHPSPIFSTKNGANWCSLNGTPDEIDPATSVSILSPPTPWIATTSLETMGIARDPNFLQYAAIYSPTEHYLGWMPMKALEDVEDPAAIAFDATPVDLYDHYTDVQRAGGSDDSGSPRFVGYYFKEEWVNNIAYLSGRLRHIVVTLALSTDWYGPNAWTLEVGDLPGEMDYQLLRMFQTNRAEASRTSGEARRCLLALMAFIAWFTSILPSWRDELQQDDKELVESLRLEERRKRGYAFKLSRDYHEWNVQHLLEHDIGCHYIWTDDEKCSGRFVRYSPEFWGEYMALRRETNTSGPLDLSALPSYAKWQSDLNRFDVFFQDKMMGRPGEVITAFNSACDYRIVDFLYYGARVLENWHVLRAYAERMKAKIVRAKIPNANDVCTFYRQDPIAQDEPADARPRLEERPFKLTDFANEEVGAKVSEEEAYFESTVIIRERVKNRYAPRSNRVYNTFNGGPKKPGSRHTFSRLSSSVSGESEGSAVGMGRGRIPPEGRIRDVPLRRARSPVMSPTRRSEHTEDRGISTRWLEQMAGSSLRTGRDVSPSYSHHSLSYNQRRRSSRSASPARVDRSRNRRSRSLSQARSATYTSDSFEDEYNDLGGEGQAEEADQPPSPLSVVPLKVFLTTLEPQYDNRFLTRGEAVAALMAWVEKMAQVEPPTPTPGDDWYWALLWLDHSYLVLKDPRAAVFLKVLAACTDAMDMIGVLNLAIRFGIPFGLYVKASAVREFRERNMTDLDRNTLSALYAPGYVDECIPYTIGGIAAYGKYLATIGNLLNRPHATGFIYAGGILSFIACFYNPDLIRRLMGGPSMQVTQFNRGDTVLLAEDDGDVFLVSDSVSPSEVSMLIGHVPTGNAATETSLWPHPSLLEKESDHVHGIYTTGYYQILENLKGDLAEGHYRWRTRREWRSYFHAGNKGKYAPPYVPSASDFAEGADLLRRSFPADWNLRSTFSITMPENFEPVSASRTLRT